MQRNGEMTMHTCVEMEELVCGRNTKHIKKLLHYLKKFMTRLYASTAVG